MKTLVDEGKDLRLYVIRIVDQIEDAAVSVDCRRIACAGAVLHLQRMENLVCVTA
ncbi:hypothetical protein [Burkholderia metallica]|uniref:hypothetical protein n=1 Tax=Burkholderia metallica TaxID=488729 RepID=UPI0015754256|nr:hypothetical protein [Burkholderia metallica]